MKRQNTILAIGILLLSTVILFSACKKKSSDTTVSPPTFSMSAVPDANNTGNLIFYITCTTDDVRMTRIDIKDPINTGIAPVDMQNAIMLKNQTYFLATSYPKESGNWVFTFTGNRTSNNSGFVATSTLLVSAK
jgi:hypothetical protein